MPSRITSASTRRGGKRQSNASSPPCLAGLLERLKASEYNSNRSVSFTDHEAALLRMGIMNSLASQSRSSGWLGFAPALPKSLAVDTMPCPNTCCQIRFTITRANSGFSRAVTHSAKRARRAAPGVFELSFRSPANSSGAAGITSARSVSGLPRCITRVTPGSTNRPIKLGRGACSSYWLMCV